MPYPWKWVQDWFEWGFGELDWWKVFLSMAGRLKGFQCSFQTKSFMRTHMETLLNFKPPLRLELIFSYQLSPIDCISCRSQQDVLLTISGFLSETVWGSALPDHSSSLLPSVECYKENMKHPSLVLCITPSLTFPLISCIPDYNPRNSAFWGHVWKCRKWRIRDLSGFIAMWFNSIAMSWCDKPCKSPNKWKE